MLQVSYSFFNKIGPSMCSSLCLFLGTKPLTPEDTWFLVGVAARMATGMGLHTSEIYQFLTVDMAEQQKRIFFCLYMMDRYVAFFGCQPRWTSDR